MPMKNSRLPDNVLAAWLQSNPIHISAKTGNIVTCPCRASWIFAFKPSDKKKNDEGVEVDGKYGVQLWFPPGAEPGIHGVMVPALLKGIAAGRPGLAPRLPENPFAAQGFTPEWIKAYYAATGGGAAGEMHNPFRDQQTQAKYGATPGLPLITATSKLKPQVHDTMGNPIVDANRLYPGCWVIASLNVYESGFKPKVQPKKGYYFGLQSLMLVADDEQLGAVAPPAADDFAGVKVDQFFDPSKALGSPMPPPTHVQGAPSYPGPVSSYPAPPAQPPAVAYGVHGASAPPAGPVWSPPGAVPPAPASYPPSPGVMPYVVPGLTAEDVL